MSDNDNLSPANGLGSIGKAFSEINELFSDILKFDSVVSKALETAGDYLKCDAVYMLKFSEINKSFFIRYYWAKNKDENDINKGNIAVDKGSQLYNEMLENRNSSALPTRANEEMLDYLGHKSVFLYPLWVKERVYGIYAMAFDTENYTPVENEIVAMSVFSCSFDSAQQKRLLYGELKNARLALDSTVDNVPLAIYWKNSNLHYVNCNRRFEEFVGKPKNEIIGRSDFDVLSQNLARRYSSDDKRLLASKQAILSYETEYESEDGEIFWLNNSKIPVCNEEGDVDLILGVFEDITKQKNVELQILQRDRELEKSIEEIKRANSAKTEFLSRMSHEIRTPLNAIIGMTYIAKRSEDAAKISECYDRIDESAKNLLDIINDILDMSRIEEDRLEIMPENFSIEKMLSDVCNSVYDSMKSKNQKLSIDVEPDVAQHYLGDPHRLSQVIINLLTNAIKFSDENTEIKLKISLLQSNKDVVTLKFSVIDCGIGLNKEQLEKLFQPFEQGDGGIARKYGGTGLGLAISKKIVELMNGRIWAESQIGEGSTFSFTADLEKTDSRAKNELMGAKKKFDPSKAHKSSVDLTGRHILLVEDIEINREVVIALLEPTNVQVVTAENGRTAVTKIKNEPDKFDLVLMDIHMPVMGGYEALKNIRMLSNPRARKIPVVAMTANALVEDIEKSRALGMDDHISKPIKESELINILLKFLDIRGNEPMDFDNTAQFTEEQFLPYYDIPDGLSRLLGNKKLLAKLLLRFNEETNMQKTSDAIAAGDTPAALENVHTLKGTSGNLSLRAIHELSVALEADLKGSGANTAALLPRLQEVYDKTKEMLDDVIAFLEA